METQFVRSRQCDSFMHDLDGFDCDLVGGGIHAGSNPTRWPSVDKIPANLLFARLIHEDDRPILTLSLPVDHLLAPFPKIFVVSLAHLEADVRILRLSRQLAVGVDFFVTFTVIDGI